MLHQGKFGKYTLDYAMVIILNEQPRKCMHIKNLANEIYEKDLFSREDGNPVPTEQIRRRIWHHKDKFFVENNIVYLIK